MNQSVSQSVTCFAPFGSQPLTLVTEVFRENVKNAKLKQGLLPAVGEMLCLVATQVSCSPMLCTSCGGDAVLGSNSGELFSCWREAVLGSSSGVLLTCSMYQLLWRCCAW